MDFYLEYSIWAGFMPILPMKVSGNVLGKVAIKEQDNRRPAQAEVQALAVVVRLRPWPFFSDLTG